MLTKVVPDWTMLRIIAVALPRPFATLISQMALFGSELAMTFATWPGRVATLRLWLTTPDVTGQVLNPLGQKKPLASETFDVS